MAIFNSYVMLYYQKVGELKLHRNQSGLKPLPGNLHFGIRHTMIMAELPQTVSAARFDRWNASNCLVQTLRGVVDPSWGSFAPMFLAPKGYVCSTLVDETPRPAA